VWKSGAAEYAQMLEDDELQCRGSFSRAAACCLPRRTEENPPLTKRIDIGGLKL